MSWIVGIDEAGRGPLAGPVAVGAVKIPAGFNKNFFKGIKDSKQLSESEREEWYKLASHAKRLGQIEYAVSLVSEKVIDRHGIAYAIRLGVKRCLKKLNVDRERSQIFLDGALKAPSEFTHQLTIIKGDEKVPVISLASVLAKVTRDRRMVSASKRFPQYEFQMHKGYGTLVHRQAILKYGLTELHRRSFIKGISPQAEV